MDFFAAQEQARKATQRLIWWFALCMLGVIVSVYAITVVVMTFIASSDRMSDGPQPVEWWNPEWFLWTAVVVGGLILTGSLTKLSQLSAGGKVVARSMGGQQVDPSTTDFKERQLLNVVEEMAIASGTPVPDVWIMQDESGINAFAAGTDPANAVIGVTRGTLDTLSRSELQGVVAHEFSHILNGDMKLNMRLMGWIFGLVMISTVGLLILRSLVYTRSSRDSKNGGILVAILLIGGAVWLVGSVGTLFARMLQAAISRQREFLADASAVQFTRDNEGITGALKKIGGYSLHGSLQSANANQARHMFFAASNLNSMLATHPPLDQRIKAIDPQWDGRMVSVEDSPRDFDTPSGQATASFAGNTAAPPPIPATAATRTLPATPPPLPVSVAAVSSQVIQSSDDAHSLLYGLLTPANESSQDLTRETLRSHGIPQARIDEAMAWSTKMRDAGTAHKLATIDHALPWLRKGSAQDARSLIASCQALIEADGQIDLFEFMMQQVLRRHIEIGRGLEPAPRIRHHQLAQLENELCQLLAVFGAASDDEASLDHALEQYREHSGSRLQVSSPDFHQAAKALIEMDAATPMVKKQILRLCALVVTHDGVVNEHETELLRATAEAIGAPIPRMVDAVASLQDA